VVRIILKMLFDIAVPLVSTALRGFVLYLHLLSYAFKMKNIVPYSKSDCCSHTFYFTRYVSSIQYTHKQKVIEESSGVPQGKKHS